MLQISAAVYLKERDEGPGRSHNDAMLGIMTETVGWAPQQRVSAFMQQTASIGWVEQDVIDSNEAVFQRRVL